MLYLLIGHRGVGKSTLLGRIGAYYAESGRAVKCIDLDRRIAERSGQTIGALFEREGEAAFREHERTTLAALLGELAADAAGDIYIALGAGYSGELPTTARVIWVRRSSDRSGRIFVRSDDGSVRPRLDPSTSPLSEYQQRFPAREQRYRDLCHLEWTLPEGLDQPSDRSPTAERWAQVYAGERERVLSLLATPEQPPTLPIGGVLTLLASHFRGGAAQWHDFIARRLGWPATRFELRDDLLDAAQLGQARASIPPDRRIFSLRRAPLTAAALASAVAEGSDWDHPLELGPLPASVRPPILSLHTRLPDETVAATAARLESAGQAMGAALLKLAIEIDSLAELETGWQWAAAAPSTRAFLPRSPRRSAETEPDRWRWFRMVSGRRSPLAFVREGDGSGLDQPLLADWWQSAGLPSPHFAAVLGDPVGHSRTPLEHQSFFAARGLPVVAVRLSLAEWAADGLAILERLGLRYAAVTAPLKSAAAAQLGRTGPDAAVNTLYYSQAAQRWLGTNTDPLGAEALLSELRDEPAVAIWGGGGTAPALRSALPRARTYSARSGQPTGQPGAGSDFAPRAVVWAVGRSRLATTVWPDSSWRPATIFDLNYSEDSPGREYAQRVGARYVSGLAMFEAQAAAQRQFWVDCEGADSAAARPRA